MNLAAWSKKLDSPTPRLLQWIAECHRLTQTLPRDLRTPNLTEIHRDHTASSIMQTDEENKNYHRAMKYIIEISKQRTPLTITLLGELHRIVSPSSVAEKELGIYRVKELAFGLSPDEILMRHPDSKRIPILMLELVQWYNRSKNIDPFIKAFGVRFFFESIHPYLDGNGRVGRLVQRWAFLDLGMQETWQVPFENIFCAQRGTATMNTWYAQQVGSPQAALDFHAYCYLEAARTCALSAV